VKPIEMLEALHNAKASYMLDATISDDDRRQDYLIYVCLRVARDCYENAFKTPTEAIEWLYAKAKELGVL
jgi:carbamate kinase